MAVFSVGQTHLGAERFATAFSPVTVVSALVVLIEILKLFWRLAMESSARDLFSAGWTVTFLIYGHLAFSLGGKRRSEGSSLVLGTAHALAVSALYRLVVDVSSLAVSGVWALYALAVLWLAFLKRDAYFAKSSLLVLAVAAGKVLIYDVASSPALIRILCLVLTGVLLYLSGFLFRKIGNLENAGT